MKVTEKMCPECGNKATTLVAHIVPYWQIAHCCNRCGWKMASNHYEWEIENWNELDPFEFSYGNIASQS